MRHLLCALLLLCGMLTQAAAQEVQPNPSDLLQAMPDQAGQMAEGSIQSGSDLAGAFGQLWQRAQGQVGAAFRAAVAGLARAGVIIVVCAAARGFGTAAGGQAVEVIDMAGALGCAAVLLYDFGNVLSYSRAAIAEIGTFSAFLQPTLAVVLSMGGQAATATTLQVATMLVFDLVIRLISAVLVPAACVFLAVAVMDAVVGNELLGGLADGISGMTSGVLKLILTLFTAYLTIAGGISGNVDRMALKTARFAVSGAVPVVGGVMSDAVETMLSGSALLRASIGVFGMVCVTAICLLPFAKAGAGYLCYRAGAMLLSPLCSKGLQKMLERVGTGFGLLFAMLSSCCVILYLELVYIIAIVRPI